MILLDTSIWIEVFRKRNPLPLQDVVAFEDIVTCLPVIQEVLQGFRDETAFRTAKEALYSLPIVESPLSAAAFDQAVHLYRTARHAGVTIRSSVDCLIASCALIHGLEILHRDRDYNALAKVSPLRSRMP